MTNYANASDALKRLAVQYQGLMDAADAFDQLAQFESIKATAQKDAALAREDAAAAADELAVARSAIKAQKAKAIEMMAESKAACSGEIESAQAKALALIADANLAAAAIVDQAKREEAAALAGIAAQVDNLTTAKALLIDEGNALEAAIYVKQAEVEALEARLLKAQAQIAKLLGA